MSAQMKSDMTGERAMKLRSFSMLVGMFLVLCGLMPSNALGQMEPPPGCGAPQAASAEDCMQCHAVSGFDPTAASMEQSAARSTLQSTLIGAQVASSTTGRVTTWEVLNLDEQTYRLHWEMNGYVMRYSIYRYYDATESPSGVAGWSLVYDKWPWGRLPSQWDNMFPMPPNPAAIKGSKPITYFRQVIYCSSGAALCGTGWIYDPALSGPIPPEAVVTVPAAGAATVVEVLKDNQLPFDNAQWGQDANLDTYHVNPMPRNEFTRIRYSIPEQGDTVVVQVKNVLSGELVYEKADAQVKAGVYYEHQWDGKTLNESGVRVDVPPGLYSVTIKVNGGAEQGSAQILLLGPDPLRSTVTVDDGFVRADNTDSAKVTATLLDGKGAPLTGWTVEMQGDTGRLSDVVATSNVYEANVWATDAGANLVHASARTATSEAIPVGEGSVVGVTFSVTRVCDNSNSVNSVPNEKKDLTEESQRRLYTSLLRDGLAHLRIESQIAPIEGSGRVLWEIRDAGSTIAAGSFVGSTTCTATFSSTGAHKIYEVLIGFDTDENGHLSDQEAPPAQRFGTVIITTDDYQDAYLELAVLGGNWGAMLGLPCASSALLLFLGLPETSGIPILPNSYDPARVSQSADDPYLTHNVGALFSASTRSSDIRSFIWSGMRFGSENLFSKKVEESTALREKINAAIKGQMGTIAGYFQANPDALEMRPQVFFPKEDVPGTDFRISEGDNSDLHLALGRAVVNGGISFTINRSLSQITALLLSGTTRDLYDFNYESSTIAQLAATCQIGWEIYKEDSDPVSGWRRPGQIFQDTVILDRVFETWPVP
jgi:hypothetical protein